MDQKYFLIDLERTIGSGSVHYWRPGSRGYTKDPLDAGQYSERDKDAVLGSPHSDTVAVEKEVVEKHIRR